MFTVEDGKSTDAHPFELRAGIGYESRGSLAAELAFGLILPSTRRFLSFDPFLLDGVEVTDDAFALSLPLATLLAAGVEVWVAEELALRVGAHAQLGGSVGHGSPAEIEAANDLGTALVWLPLTWANALVELAYSSSEELGEDPMSARTSVFVVNPGVRFAIDLELGLQFIPGVSAPIQLGTRRASPRRHRWSELRGGLFTEVGAEEAERDPSCGSTNGRAQGTERRAHQRSGLRAGETCGKAADDPPTGLLGLSEVRVAT